MNSGCTSRPENDFVLVMMRIPKTYGEMKGMQFRLVIRSLAITISGGGIGTVEDFLYLAWITYLGSSGRTIWM